MTSRGEEGAADTVPVDPGTPSDLEVPPDLDARPAVCARSRRAAFAAFVALEIAALPVLLHLGRNRWFQYDEWDFLASRDAGSLGDLFEPHNVHWSTLPILAYRGLWQLFGINTYFPYLLLVVVSHLGVVALVRGVMRRSGVRPLPVELEHALRAGGLPMHHRDPFDRMIVAQAQLERLAVLTADPWFQAYRVPVVPA
jgi:hypothetical protein